MCFSLFLSKSPPSHALVHVAPQPSCWPPVAGWVDSSVGEQFIRREEPQPRLDLRPVCEGPMGALSAHLLATGAPSQALLHCSRICLALCFHTATAAAATSWPQVQEHTFDIDYSSYPVKNMCMKGSNMRWNSFSSSLPVFLQQSSECEEDQHCRHKRQLHLSVA